MDIFKAIEDGNVEEARRLIEEDASVIESTDGFGLTPLRWAAFYGHKDIVDLLLDKGAKINPKEKGGRTPLYWAAKQGHMDVVELLVARGAVTKAGATKLLFVAAEDGCEALAKVAIENGGDVNASEGKDQEGWTPLTEASQKGQTEIVKLLLANGADVTVNWGGMTPLHQASNREIAKALVAHGADIRAKDKVGRSPLDTIPDAGATEVLLQKGKWEKRDLNGALNCAAGTHLVDTMRVLLDHGADINVRNRQGRTALSWAAQYGFLASLKLFLERGADANSRDKEGQTPLDWAIEMGNNEAAEILRAHANNPVSQAKKGFRWPWSR